jgi:hypothetical protein
MRKETKLTYKERLKERNIVLLRINEAKAKLKVKRRKISDLQTQLE